MSDDREFAKIAESLRREGFGSRALLLDRLRQRRVARSWRLVPAGNGRAAGAH